MNCTEEEADGLVKKYWEREYARIQEIEFPPVREHPITEKELVSELSSLRTKDLSWKANTKIVPYFHKSLVYANKKGKLSQYEFWQKLKSDDTLFRKFYRNRLRSSDYFNESPEKHEMLLRGEVPDFIYGIGLTTGMFAPKVSVFKPGAAKYLIKKYLLNYPTIFDPTAGYSARMLGTIACGRNFVGRDINDLTIKESEECLSFVKERMPVGSVDLRVADALKETGEYPCLFTCPPYEDIEEWRNSSGAKITSGMSCDEWIDALTSNYKCERYVIVVDGKIERYKNYVAEEFVNTNYINARNGKLTDASYNSEKVVVIS